MKSRKTTPTWIFPHSLLIFITLAVAACSEPQTNEAAKQAAQNFVNSYYVNADTAAAIKYTTGSAKEKLASELAVIKEAGANAENIKKPQTTIRELSSEKMSENEVSLSWEVAATTGNKLTATTVVQKTAKNWLVSKLTENALSEN